MNRQKVKKSCEYCVMFGEAIRSECLQLVTQFFLFFQIVRRRHVVGRYPKVTDSLDKKAERHWRKQRREGKDGFKPPIESSKILYCVFAKYTLQALLLCSLNLKFYTGKR